jgi:hypothetical protein
VVTIEPVYIAGDAGTRKLIAQHDARSGTPDCRIETRDATTSALALGAGALAAAGTVATGGAGLIIAGCIVGLFGLGIDAGAKGRDLQECKKP